MTPDFKKASVLKDANVGYYSSCEPPEAKHQPDAFEIARHSKRLVEQLREELSAATAERDQLRAEAERLRMQLAACGVVALANTPESAAKARDMHPDYMSASCQDVMRVVDREMALRAEVEALRKDAERYRWLRKGESDDVAVVRGLGAMDYGMSAVAYTHSEEIDGDDLDAAIDAAMAAKEGE
ncbi:MAG TPA: hypothetical protein VKY70_00865 [Pseudomonas sp.]|nr:hypothetical protein [Pseudomonas sp.]